MAILGPTLDGVTPGQNPCQALLSTFVNGGVDMWVASGVDGAQCVAREEHACRDIFLS